MNDEAVYRTAPATPGLLITSILVLLKLVLIFFVKDCVFFLLNMIIHDHNVLEYTNKNYESNTDRADEGGRVGWGNADNG